MSKFEIRRVNDTPEDYPFDSIRCPYLTIRDGVYIFHSRGAESTPDAVYPIRSFMVAKVEG